MGSIILKIKQNILFTLIKENSRRIITIAIIIKKESYQPKKNLK